MKTHKEMMRDYLVRKTAEFSKINGYGEVKDLSHKAQEAEKIIRKADFGCAKGAVAELMSLILEEKIETFSESVKTVKGAVIVPLANNGGHNYKLDGCTVYLRDGSRACFPNKYGYDGDSYREGNDMDSKKGSLRPATEEEIDEMIEYFEDKEKDNPEIIENNDDSFLNILHCELRIEFVPV